MTKSTKKANSTGKDTGSTSKTPETTKKSIDEELARKLNEELNAGHIDDDGHNDHHSGSDYPEEILYAVKRVKRYADHVLRTTCYHCEEPLIHEFHVPSWLEKWQNPKTKFASGCRCQCGATTCLGCGDKALSKNSKYIIQYEGQKLDFCCNKGAVFIAWVVLCHYDNMELDLQARSQQNQRQLMQRNPAQQRLAGTGTGFGAGGWMNPFDGTNIHAAANEGWRRPGLQQALNFKQVDKETDGVTKWILGILIELLPKNGETKKVNPAMGSMIELSLLQDRVAELLRNDSLQDADKRAKLYFTTFAFVGRLGAHGDLDYLVREQRFVKKQSAGLQAIATSRSGGNGKSKAQMALTVASKRDGMAPPLVSCLTNLATQSKVLLGGSNNKAAGGDILELAERIDKVYTRLAGAVTKISTVTTWKEYHKENCLVRKPNVARYLCSSMANLASQVKESYPGRMKRLVTEASEMTTSLPEGIFVRVDDVRADVMKALIIGPEDTPYEGGLFEFDIVCGEKYPFEPPSVWFLTTGQGKIGFNPNLYASGKVCLSLINTWTGGPETKWQPSRSTITSILVSIQSMILCPWPWENEPGRENAHARPALLPKCQEYNENIRRATLKHATLD
ncbi:MAG: hypothetical protein Q9170_008362, partial [Blastenia crenularia]